MAAPEVGGRAFLVVGLARSGCAAGALLRRHGARVIGIDDAPAADLHASWDAQGLSELAGAGFDEVVTGGAWDGVAGRRLDGVVLSPGVPRTHPRVTELARRLPVHGELEWAARFCAARIVAITGTNGKTTTTELTAHLARAQGWPAEALGNVGRPLSQRADKLGPSDLAVLEVSSFQLESIEKFQPHVAVVLNLDPDHLDRYPDLGAYWAAKRRLVRALPADGWYVAWTGCAEAVSWGRGRRVLTFGERAAGAAVSMDEGAVTWNRPGERVVLARSGELAIRGAPNLRNAAAAVAALLPLAPAPEALAAGLRSFQGLPHRQQRVAVLGGVEFVDDSKATNVAAVTAGLQGYAGDVVVIMGGRGKGEDYGALRAALACVRAVITIGEEGPAIAAALQGAVRLEQSATLEEAVDRAAVLAAPRGTVLLSPACASFDMFRDYAARGEAFAAAARALGARPLAAASEREGDGA